jgi:hypothetical protein
MPQIGSIAVSDAEISVTLVPGGVVRTLANEFPVPRGSNDAQRIANFEQDAATFLEQKMAGRVNVTIIAGIVGGVLKILKLSLTDPGVTPPRIPLT